MAGGMKKYMNYLSEKQVIKREADAAARTQTATAHANQNWEANYEPQLQEYANARERETQRAYDTAVAQGRAALGYTRSSGSGTSGTWDRYSESLYNEATAKQMELSGMDEKLMQEAYLNYMSTKDAQEFQKAMAAINYNYAKKLAEANSPDWWSTLGGIVGSIAGILSMKKTKAAA